MEFLARNPFLVALAVWVASSFFYMPFGEQDRLGATFGLMMITLAPPALLLGAMAVLFVRVRPHVTKLLNVASAILIALVAVQMSTYGIEATCTGCNPTFSAMLLALVAAELSVAIHMTPIWVVQRRDAGSG